MITFDRAAELRALPETRLGRCVFEVVAPIEVRLNGSFLCVIEAGFRSDGASIPWWARGKWSSWGRHALPALLHDHLLETSDLPKWTIDWIFFGALKAQGVPDLEAVIFWLAVRARR